jgi:UDP-N-acetylglucosamine 2-epimerase (non-hydrolysing)
VTLRNNTERPETIDVGSKVLVGTNPEKILVAVRHMTDIPRKWDNPFGDGDVAQRIIDTRRKRRTLKFLVA